MSPHPDTIVLIHGFWVTPRSWEDWIAHYEAKGFRVLAPAYPGFEVEVEALNADPTPIETVTVPAIIEHLEQIVVGLDAPPILMGHSAGGVFTQILLDHGLGAVGVAINSAPTEGVKRVPLSQVKATFPGAQEPGQPPQGGGVHVRAVAVRVHQRVSARTSHAVCTSATTSPRRARSSGAARWPTSTRARTTTGSTTRTRKRAPLLFISGTQDNLMPPSIQHSNAKHYKAPGLVTETKDFEGPHLLPSWPGWEEVADYALGWALEHASPAGG